MKNALKLSLLSLFISISFASQSQSSLIIKASVTYDFTFAELAIEYLETGDTSILNKIAETGGARHILAHAKNFNYDVPKGSALDLVKYLLTPIEEKRTLLPKVKRNMMYARDSIAGTDLSQIECLKSLPAGFHYNPSTYLFFTFGYDLGVTIDGNSSVNLAHPHYLKDMHELRYYSIHELHHAGFIQIRNNYMVGLNIHTFGEMATVIEYLTQLEGMGTYAPWALRIKEHAMDADRDYVALQDTSLMRANENEYFEIYRYFRDHPEDTLTDMDWDKLSILSDRKRLWYRVGALMAASIQQKYGITKVTDLMKTDPSQFSKTFQQIMQDQ